MQNPTMRTLARFALRMRISSVQCIQRSAAVVADPAAASKYRNTAPGASHTAALRLGCVFASLRPCVKRAFALVVFLLTIFTHAQDLQFFFDANGNLFVQTAEIAAPPQIIGQ